MRSASSPTLHNASLVSTVSIPNTLNQGFIDPDDTMDLDATRSTLASLTMMETGSEGGGKGSLVEGVDTKAATKKRREGRQLNTTFTKTSPSEVSKVGRSEIEDYKPVNTSNGRSIKSVSAEDLKSRVKGERPTARSNSMYVASSGRHANVIPNLQICAETHKLLARAGFLEDSDLPPSVKDISLPARSPKKSRGQSFHLSRSDQKGSSFRSERSVISRESSSREDVREKEHRRTEVPEGNKKVKGTVEAVSQVLEPMKEELAEAMETRPQAEKPNQVHHQSGTSHQPTLSLKRAEMRMQKHESVAQIKESNAGHVAANVQQINSSLEHSGLDQSDASLHFPTCTTRKRGVSPIRIPTIFATTDKKADYYRSLAQKACRRLEDQKTANINTNRTDQSAARQGDKKHLQVPGTDKQFIFTDGESDLSSSLLETIDDVVTPRSQKHCTLTSRSPLQEATNTKPVTAHRAADNEDTVSKAVRRVPPNYTYLSQLASRLAKATKYTFRYGQAFDLNFYTADGTAFDYMAGTTATSDPVAELQAAADVIRLGRDKDQSEAALRRMEAIHRRMNTYIHELQKQNKELKERTQKQARMLKLQEKSLQSWKKLYENFGERQFSVKK
nr:hypothetical protein BaRGS_018726 [Batillaria attramentaria]